MREDLRRAIAAAASEDLPALLGEIEEARAEAWRRLHEEAMRPRELRLLSVDEASEIARLPRRRLFSLARRAPWAVRVGRRLLVEDGAFRRWLDSGRHVRGAHESASEAPGKHSPRAARARSRTPVTRRGA